jgi:hypothetical protein
MTKKDLSKTKLKLTDEITSNNCDINNNTSIISQLLNGQNGFPLGKEGFVYKPATKGSWFRGKVAVVNDNGILYFKYYLENNNNNTLLLIAKKHSRNEYHIYGDEMLRNSISKLTNNFLGNQYVLQKIISTNNNNNYINGQILCKVKYVSLVIYLDI